MLGQAIAIFLFARVDILFLARYLDFQSLGVYAVAAQLIGLIDLVMGALAGICIPKSTIAIRSRDHFRTFVKESFFAILLVEAGIAFFILLTTHIVTLFYGTEYALAGSILRILLYGWVFFVVLVPFSFLFYALDDARTRFYLEVLKLATGVLLLYSLVPQYGLTGGAWAMTFTLMVSTVTSLGVLRYRLKCTYGGLCLC
jgi:O-antigen/teichoic acid export membrane protein